MEWSAKVTARNYPKRFLILSFHREYHRIDSSLLETFFSTIFVNYSKTQYLRNSQLPENFLRRKYNENAFDLPIFSIIIYALTGSPSIKFDVCKLSTDRDRNEIRARKKVTSQALFVRS